jgi:hypothetical protein
MPSHSVSELAHEYQDYVLAHRLRRLLGGSLSPKPLLSLGQYAKKRLERQQVARDIVMVKPLSFERLRRIDELTDELCFGLWRTPFGMTDFLRAAWRVGGHAVLEDAHAFATVLLTAEERGRLPQAGAEVASYAHACLRLAAAAINPDELELALDRVESVARAVPLFLDEFNSESCISEPSNETDTEQPW